MASWTDEMVSWTEDKVKNSRTVMDIPGQLAEAINKSKPLLQVVLLIDWLKIQTNQRCYNELHADNIYCTTLKHSFFFLKISHILVSAPQHLLHLSG